MERIDHAGVIAETVGDEGSRHPRNRPWGNDPKLGSQSSPRNKKFGRPSKMKIKRGQTSNMSRGHQFIFPMPPAPLPGNVHDDDGDREC